MELGNWLVLMGGLAAIVWVNWYFFVAGRKPSAVATGAGGVQEQVIVVNGGYSPATIKVKAGRAVRLIFDRKDSGACSDEVVFPDFGIRQFTPSGKRTTIDITPAKAGRYDFTCGMSMHHGSLIAEE